MVSGVIMIDATPPRPHRPLGTYRRGRARYRCSDRRPVPQSCARTLRGSHWLGRPFRDHLASRAGVRYSRAGRRKRPAVPTAGQKPETVNEDNRLPARGVGEFDLLWFMIHRLVCGSPAEEESQDEVLYGSYYRGRQAYHFQSGSLGAKSRWQSLTLSCNPAPLQPRHRKSLPYRDGFDR